MRCINHHPLAVVFEDFREIFIELAIRKFKRVNCNTIKPLLLERINQKALRHDFQQSKLSFYSKAYVFWEYICIFLFDY